MKVDFRRLTWENYPSEETPINADNLNRLEEGVAGLYSDVAEMEEKIGDNVGEYVTDWLNEHVDPVGSAVVVDDALAIAGAAADAKKTGDEISSLKEEISQLDGLSEDVKQALLQIAEKVAYIDEDGQDYYDTLYDALYPPANLVSISAVYTPSGTVYNTDSLDSLKSDLVVTALYDDQSTEIVTTYTLSGTLETGTSTITVAYGGKTTTFTVNVVEWVTSITATYTQSGTVYDTATLDDLKSDLVVTASYADGTSGTTADYTLSGTLVAGTSTITVMCFGKTDTFNVTVTSTAVSTTWVKGQLGSSGNVDTTGTATANGSYCTDYIPITNGQTISFYSTDSEWTTKSPTNDATWITCVFYKLMSSQAYGYINPRLTYNQETNSYSFECTSTYSAAVAVRMSISNLASETNRNNIVIRVV